MNWRLRLAYGLALALAVALAGCESVALMPRPDVDRRSADTRDLDRGGMGPSRNYPGDVRQGDRTVPRDEVVGTVERIDTTNREIQLRTTEARLITIKYDPNTTVQSRDRELRVDSLRRGDLILVQVSRNSRGERYADLIRMNDRGELGSRSSY